MCVGAATRAQHRTDPSAGAPKKGGPVLTDESTPVLFDKGSKLGIAIKSVIGHLKLLRNSGSHQKCDRPLETLAQLLLTISSILADNDLVQIQTHIAHSLLRLLRHHSSILPRFDMLTYSQKLPLQISYKQLKDLWRAACCIPSYSSSSAMRSRLRAHMVTAPLLYRGCRQLQKTSIASSDVLPEP